MADETSRTITHGLGAALGGLISAQLEEVERAHRRALAACEANVREQVAREIEAIDREGMHACDALLFAEGARVARGERRPTNPAQPARTQQPDLSGGAV